ncbi:MAG: hypothetical protein ABW068_02915 [Candidatus Thiodiazotropha sp.]
MKDELNNDAAALMLDEQPELFRVESVDHLPPLAQDESCRIVKQYFDFLEYSLTRRVEPTDIGELREMLVEISKFIRSEKTVIRADGYLRMLKRLTRIYAQGVNARDDRAFAGTAVNFADIINVLSHSYPGYDYSESVGLLLYYMNKLFSYREEGWIDLYEQLLLMPDTTQVMRLLRVQHMQEIQNWIEEGVDNLFTIWDEQLEVIEQLNSEILELDRAIVQGRKAQFLDRRNSRPNVISLNKQRQRNNIAQIRQEREKLIEERNAKLELADLLSENIQEFTDRLTDIRRSATIQLVWSKS